MSDNGKQQICVAVIGSGVTGLAAAWHLHQNCANVDVDLFEKEDRLGGHAHTVTVGKDNVDCDIGFMVYNYTNYPNLMKWFDEYLKIDHIDTDMSLSVSLDGGKSIEWCSDGLNGVFANRKQLLSPSFYRFFSEMFRFHVEATNLLKLPKDDPRRHVTIGEYLHTNGYSKSFGVYYLLPMMAALWSASMHDVWNFPAAQLIGFMANHKLLQILDRPQWKTCAHRSQQYTNKIGEIMGDSVHLSTPIVSVKPQGGKYELFTTDSKRTGKQYDHVIFAVAPGIAKAMLSECPLSPDLLDILSKVRYENNEIFVHSDKSLMPQRRRAWTSWNCLGRTSELEQAFENKSKVDGKVDSGQDESRMKAVYVTYWLNRLQHLKTDQNIFVTLNPHTKPDPSLVHKVVYMGHPQFTKETLQARDDLVQKGIQGQDGLWFCGAWQGYGFHEDGCRAGFEVATKLSKIPLPWCQDTKDKALILPPPDFTKIVPYQTSLGKIIDWFKITVGVKLPIAICKPVVLAFLKQQITIGKLSLKFNDGKIISFGKEGHPKYMDQSTPVTLRIFDEWMFCKIAWEHDLGLARAYMDGLFVVEPTKPSEEDSTSMLQLPQDRSNVTIGDPVGLTRLFIMFIANRDLSKYPHVPRKSARGHSSFSKVAMNAGAITSRLGNLCNYLIYRWTMDNSERGGSLQNIHAHYDISNDLFTSFLDDETLMYSSAIFDAVYSPPQGNIVLRGTLEDAQWRKLNHLLDRAFIKPGQNLLDIGFGWGGLSILAAKKYGCHVTGITLSVEQKALAEERVKQEGLQDLITFEVVDYRVFARRKENCGKFDRIVSCEMIEAVGHDHLNSFFWGVEQLLAPDGVFVMEAITMPESRYEGYRRCTDFINTIIFPGGCCPSVHALADAAYKASGLSLEHIDQIGYHYAHTLRAWRAKFNSKEKYIRSLGFDDVFLRCWNYYLSYCEAGFHTRSVNCVVLVFSRQGCTAIAPLQETQLIVQGKKKSSPEAHLTNGELANWLADGKK